MEDLMSMAIMLIYPDGTVERIPIGEYTLHIDYMREHLKNSPRFYQICRGLDFEKSCLHGHIDSMLALNGVIIIFNFDLEEIVKYGFSSERKPYLFISLPDKLKSLEQVLAIEGVYETYPKDRIGYERFDEKNDNYLAGNRFNITRYIKDAKEIYKSRSI